MFTAARSPDAIALITVAGPDTTSPPEKTPGMLVTPFLSQLTVPSGFVSTSSPVKSPVTSENSPIAGIMISTSK